MQFLYILPVIAAFIGSIEDVGAYNYMDDLAQSMCTSIVKSENWVFAVPRNCNQKVVPTCNDVCNSAKQEMSKHLPHRIWNSAKCFDAYQIRHTDNTYFSCSAEKPFRAMYRYHDNGCTGWTTGCGPNYCCCILS